MADIIKCSGGEVMSTMPITPGGLGVVIVTCEEDLSTCRTAMEAGVPVHSTEFILGGVLRQELDPHSYPHCYLVTPWHGHKRLLEITGVCRCTAGRSVDFVYFWG